MDSITDQNQIFDKIAQWSNNAQNIVVFTGAGMSTESGIPDFRSPEGIWSKYNPMKYGTIEAFLSNSKKVWKFFLDLYKMSKDTRPNLGHQVLVKLERMKHKQNPNASFIVVTQNIDRFHQEAGSSNVIELHGNGKEVICLSCKRIYPFDSIDTRSLPPICPHCSGLLKVNAILFGESLPLKAFQLAKQAVRNSDFLLVLGTSLEVYPASSVIFSAQSKKVIVNLTNTAYDHEFDAVIHTRISEALEKVLLAVERLSI